MVTPRHHILIVLADAHQRSVFAQSLGSEFIPHPAQTGQEALVLLEQHPMTLLLADDTLPDMSGVDLLHRSQHLRPDALCLLLMDPACMDGFRHAVNETLLYQILLKPCPLGQLRLTVRRAVEAYELAADNARLSAQVAELFKGTLRAVMDALDAKDPYTRGHSYRVTQYALAMGRQLNLSQEQLHHLELGGLLHDLGKIGVPESILLKEGRLADEEFTLLKAHPARGHRMLWGVPGMEDALDVVRHHHERLDGRGYPDGLRGEQIPLLARILAVADAYDAMTSTRPYRPAMPHVEAVGELQRNVGTQFDSQVVNAFLSLREMAEVRQVIEQAPDLPSLSPVLREALRMLAFPEPDLKELAHMLSGDQGIAAKVLRLVNSAHFALRRKITSVTEAVLFMGLRGVQRLLLTIAAQPVLESARSDALWCHSLTCAFSAETVAQRTPDMDAHEAFVAGLLHDVGKTLLQRHFPAAFQRVRNLIQSGTPSAVAEIMALGVEHAEIGAWLLERWELPTVLCDAVRYHHAPYLTTQALAHLVALANEMAHHIEEGTQVPVDGALFLEHFRLKPDDLPALKTEVQDRVDTFLEHIDSLALQSSPTASSTQIVHGVGVDEGQEVTFYDDSGFETRTDGKHRYHCARLHGAGRSR